MDQTTKRNARNKSLLLLTLAALGVVYGDIGTSPLYAVNEIFFGHGHVVLTPDNIIGAISTVLWTLTLIVTVKYVTFVLRAEYEGGGGIFAVFGLLKGISKRSVVILSTFLVLAAGLLIGDGTITPAISVLSAVEGLKSISVALAPWVIPVTVIILTALFAVQYKGTASIGKVFGVFMVVWFGVIGILGLRQIVVAPAILQAFNPVFAFMFLRREGIVGTMIALGSVILVATGGEALYADLGHFGVKPIRLSWLGLVYPALLANYLGQGAYLLSGAAVTGGNVFYSMVPAMTLIPMIVLATIATVIASQALISGAFSLAAQAIVQNLSPRLKIIHASESHEGQIYVPTVNWALYVGCMGLVLTFRSSANLASAYGLAETGVMFATSISMFFISRYRWKWNLPASLAIFGTFVLIDTAFIASNSLKFLEGGYVPLAIGLILFSIMLIWRWGRESISDAYEIFVKTRTLEWIVDLKRRIQDGGGVLVDSMGRLAETNRAIVFLKNKPYRSLQEGVPAVTRLYLKRNGVIPKCMIFLNVSIEKDAYLDEDARSEVFDLGYDIFAINVRYGFMENPDIRELLANLQSRGLIPYNISRCTISAGEEDWIIDQDTPFFKRVRATLFKYLFQLAVPAFRYFGLGGDTNLSTVLIPFHASAQGTSVVRLSDDEVAL